MDYLIILIIIGGIGFFIYSLRKSKTVTPWKNNPRTQQPEAQLEKDTTSAIRLPSEESPENSLRDDFLTVVRYGKAEKVKAALAAGVDPNCIIEGEVPLMVAASVGIVEKVEVLLNAGADPNYRDSCGRDALISAALRLDSKHTDLLPVIDKLLKSGANPNHTENNFQSAIQLAAYFDHLEAVKMILSSNLISETFNLEKAIENAKENGNQEIIILLKSYLDKVRSKAEALKTHTTIDTKKDATAEKTIYFGKMTDKTVDVTISVEGYIHGSDLYGGKYHAKLPVNMISDQLLNHIAAKIGVVGGFHMGYMLLLNGKTILTCREKKTLRETDVKDGDTLTFMDWG